MRGLFGAEIEFVFTHADAGQAFVYATEDRLEEVESPLLIDEDRVEMVDVALQVRDELLKFDEAVGVGGHDDHMILGSGS